MHHFFDAIQNTTGDAQPGYFVRLIDPATLTVVAIFSDDNGTPIISSSGVADMARADELGNVNFYVEPGAYNLEVYAPDAVTFKRRINNVAMTSEKGEKGDPGNQGEQGPPGSADNTYSVLAAFKASDIGRKTASLVGVPGVTDGRFNWTLGNFTGQADDVNIIKADSTALSVGAWVRQQADAITFKQIGLNAKLRSSQDKARQAPISLYDFKSANFEGDCIQAMDEAIAAAILSGNPAIQVPNNVTLGRHIIDGYTDITIIGGKNVTFDNSVNAAGFFLGSGKKICIRDFVDASLRMHPASGGNIADAHLFVGLLGGCVIEDVFILNNSTTGGRVGISVGFENGRTLTGLCRVENNICRDNNGVEGGEGYGIHYANENDVGQAQIVGNRVERAGRHSFYIARNKSGPIVISYNTAFNHREATPAIGAVRVAFSLTRSSNIVGFGNTVDGYTDGAFMVGEEPDGESGSGTSLDAENVRLFGTSIRNPKNTVPAIWSGFQEPSSTARTRNLVFDGVTFESELNGATLFQYQWGIGITLRNFDIIYRNCTAGARMLILTGNNTGNTNGLLVENGRIRVINCTGTFSIIRPTTPFATNSMPLSVKDVAVLEQTGGATVNPWEPTVAISNNSIEVIGFSAPTPLATGVLPRSTLNPSGFTKVAVATSPWSPGTINAGATSQLNISANGAVLGDFAVASYSVSIGVLTISAAVTSSNVVTVTLTNNTGGPITPTNATAKVAVFRG